MLFHLLRNHNLAEPFSKEQIDGMADGSLPVSIWETVVKMGSTKIVVTPSVFLFSDGGRR